MAAGKNGDLRLVMFPSLAFGHINPFIHLSNKLSTYPGVKISFLTAAANVHRVKSMLNPTIEIISFTLPPVAGLPPGVESTSDASPATAELLKLALDLTQPQIKTLLKVLKPHFIFFDFAQPWVPSMASDIGIKSIFFSVILTIATAYIAIPSWLQTTPTIEEIKIPPPGFPTTTGLKTFEAEDCLFFFKSFNGNQSLFNRLMKCFNECDLILIKSSREMEGPYIDYLNEQLGKQIHLIGPVVPEPHDSGELEEKWDNWLNQFPPKSVIYCSFGSETFLTDDQIKEISLGLELTKLPFLLVLNFPTNLDSSEELKRALQEGFTERIKERGVVHSGWVQQRHILAHASVGFYVTHAGFGSLVEGLVNDCMLVMVPLKGDQFMNSKLMAFYWKVGVEVNRRDEDGYFTKEDINEGVRRVMVDVEDEDGKSIRENHKKWKEFLQNNEIQNNFVRDLVEKMKSLSLSIPMAK